MNSGKACPAVTLAGNASRMHVTLMGVAAVTVHGMPPKRTLTAEGVDAKPLPETLRDSPPALLPSALLTAVTVSGTSSLAFGE